MSHPQTGPPSLPPPTPRAPAPPTPRLAHRILLVNRIHRLPVVDERGVLVGVLSKSNLVKAALALRTAAAASNN